jgi:hypothetical protein
MPMIRGATKRVRDDARVVDGCVVGDVVARARHVEMGGVKIDASIARGARSGATTRGGRGRAREWLDRWRARAVKELFEHDA